MQHYLDDRAAGTANLEAAFLSPFRALDSDRIYINITSVLKSVTCGREACFLSGTDTAYIYAGFLLFKLLNKKQYTLQILPAEGIWGPTCGK